MQLKAGAERERKRLLKSVKVVGVTCCGAVAPLLGDLRFEVCVLDECSQIVEPLSLLALSRAQCRCVLPHHPGVNPCPFTSRAAWMRE